MRTSLPCLLLVATQLLACGDLPTAELDGQASSPIIGGKQAKVGDYPTVVAMLNTGLCTGTLIAPKVVILAAHCVDPQILGLGSQAQVTANTQIVFDAVNVYDASQGFAVNAAQTFFNSKFDINTLTNDIGAVILKTPVKDRPPSTYSVDASDAKPGDKVDQIGFGVTQPGGMNAGVEYELLGKALADCGAILGDPSGNQHYLCYDQSNGSGKCEGDSGGPSFRMVNGAQKLVGITSFGDQNCVQFGVDTRVSDQQAFIEMALEKGGACDPDGDCVASCGAKDPDCVALCQNSDGNCSQDCNVNGLPPDPDCLDCSADMFCTQGCGDAGNPADPDCLDCSADGNCTDGCGANGNPLDVDCPNICVGGDGLCRPECGQNGLPADPDCDSPAGCGCTTAPSRGTGSAIAAALLVLGIALRSRQPRRGARAR